MNFTLQDDVLGNPIAPEAIGFSFDAPGWYFLGALIVLFALGALAFKGYHYRKNAFRRAAVQQIEQVNGDLSEQLTLCFVLLKKVALRSFTKAEMGLTDLVMLEKLNRRVKKQLFTDRDLEVWEKVNYQNTQGLSEEELRSCKERVVFWIKNHRLQ